MPLASEQAYVFHMPPALPGVSQSATTFGAGRVCAVRSGPLDPRTGKIVAVIDPQTGLPMRPGIKRMI